MSKMVDHVIDVIRGAKNDILTDISKNGGVKEEDAVNIVKKQFRIVAGTYNVKESTIRSNCTREITMTTEEFASAVVQQITGLSNDLLEKIVQNCKDNRGNDNKVNIDRKIKCI